ncbi:MAG: hypothetical protein XD40_2347 [Archaeoglobus fulgidus]|uniref:KaiC-like domain-containing protein n=1 Tax=Archaeoglobus fulgidus TaxID=2234 RepID=A0A101DBF4_ARCFL|nr:MAG: hypothetical protein XD40_2347 [Archaeoglobus fulgidus]KUK05478.1 MAG: hypothetical protein XD48_2282 [Archaeoglobus fulgidus]
MLSAAANVAINGENVTYISFEEPRQQIEETLKFLGYGEVEGLEILSLNPRMISLRALYDILSKTVLDHRTMLFIDGLNAIRREFGEAFHRVVRDVVFQMKKNGITVVISLIGGTIKETLLSTIVDNVVELRVVEKGYDISEVVGKKFIEFIWEGNREDVLKIIRSLTDGAECEIRALAKKKDGRAWIDARCKKVGEYLIVVARDVSRLVSLETLLRATLDMLRHSPSEIDEVENILREYFDDASFSEKIQDFKIKVGEVTVPVRFQDRVLGSLKIQLPDWFEVTAEDMELFNVLGECVAKNMIMLESRRIIRSSLVAIKAASENLALLVDRIRNPLAAINGFVEVKVGGDVYEKVHEQVMAIEEIVKTLDDEWEKVDRLADKLSEAFSVLEKLGTTESQKINKKRKT